MSTLNLSLRQIASALGGETAGGQVLAPSPGHSAKDRGMAVKIDASAPDGFLVALHNGGDEIAAKDYVRSRLGLPPWKPNGNANSHARPAATSGLSKEERTRIANERVAKRMAKLDETEAPRVVASYDYTDEAGALLYTVQRLEPKTFRQRAADGTWKLEGVRRVLFRLPEILAHESATIFFAEGEKDALALVDLDLIATTISGGTSWTPEIAEPLRGRDVVIVPDLDTAGAKKAWEAASALHGVAASVRMVTLPGLSGKPGDKDVSDWLNADSARAGTLADLALAAPLWIPCPAPPDPVAEGDDASKKTRREPIKLTYFRDFGASLLRRWLLKGIIAKGETSAWVGPPGSGKSALMTELSVHCAGWRDWRGHKAKERCGVLILALERADLYRRRLHAYRLRDSLPAELPIAVSSTIIGLLDPTCVGLIVDAVRETEAVFGCPVGLIVVDTFSKGIAVDGGDEDKARDQNRAAANLRGIQNQLNVHIALVGHTGKDESRGPRGSNAHLGDVDVLVMISGDPVRTAEVAKGNDQRERALLQYKLETFDLGSDEDGDRNTTSIVSTEVLEVANAKKVIELSPVPKAALRSLFDLIADGETAPRPENMHTPAGVTCVTTTSWRERLISRGVIDRENNLNRTQFKRIRVTLGNAGKIGVWGDVVWPVT